MVNAVAFPEQQKNRVLRRVDWRFLLRDPHPRKSICFATGLLRDAVAEISSLVVGPEHCGEGDCDLAVAENPSTEVIRAANAALESGGEFYCEWTSLLPGSYHKLQRQLINAGFSDINIYWVWPPPSRDTPLFWLPLESFTVYSYFVSNQVRSRTISSSIRRWLLHFFSITGLKNIVLKPVCIVARKLRGDAQMARTDGLNRVIRTSWSKWGFGTPPNHLFWMLWTPGHRSISKVLAYLFDDSSINPRLVIKIARTGRSNLKLFRERDNLQSLGITASSRPGEIPQVLFFENWNGNIAIGETFLHGLPVYMRVDRQNFRDLAVKCTDWLADFAGESRIRPKSEWWTRLVEIPFERFKSNFSSVCETDEMARISDILHQLCDLPLVNEHRDFSPWNVYLRIDGGLGVLDWESAELNGLPAMDLNYFFTYLAFFLDGAMESGRYIAAYRKALDPRSPVGRVWSESEDRYCNRLGITRNAIRPLRLLTWLIHSQDEYQQLTEDAGREPAPRVLTNSLFCSLVREELRGEGQTGH